jgi:membrane protein DedA with SNARE-associated domain
VTDAQTLIHNISGFSYFGVFIISILANVVVPVPEEIVILAIGYVVGTGKIDGFIVLPIVIAGLWLSDTIMYLLARRGTRFLTAFYERFFSTFIGSKREWVENSTHEVVFYTRFLMQFRFLGPFIAGQRKMPYRKFVTYELAALVIYVPFLLMIGDYFRDRFELITSGVGTVRNIILAILSLLVVISILKVLRDITLGDYTLSLTGTKAERTLIPGIYKKKK